MRFRDPDMEALACELEIEGVGCIVGAPPGWRPQREITMDARRRRREVLAAVEQGESTLSIAVRLGIGTSRVTDLALQEWRRQRRAGERSDTHDEWRESVRRARAERDRPSTGNGGG